MRITGRRWTRKEGGQLVCKGSESERIEFTPKSERLRCFRFTDRKEQGHENRRTRALDYINSVALHKPRLSKPRCPRPYYEWIDLEDNGV